MINWKRPEGLDFYLEATHDVHDVRCKKHSQIFKVSPPSRPAHERSCYEVGLRKFPKITAVRRWYSSFGWNFRHNTTEWTFKNVVLAFQNVLTFENSLWWRLLVNDQKISDGLTNIGSLRGVRYLLLSSGKIFARIEWKDTSKNPTGSTNGRYKRR